MSKYLVSLILLLSIQANAADTLKFNPFTNNLDITGAASSGSGGGIVSPATFTWTNSFGMSMSTLTLTSAPSGSVIFSSTSGKLFQDNSLFHWDDNLGFLGIGTNSPNHTLHIRASPNTTPLRIAYDDDIYMDVTQGGATFNMKVVGSTSFQLNNQTDPTNASALSLSSNGDIALNQDGNLGLNRLIVNGNGTGFRAGDPSDTNYLDYQSGGVLAGFIATGYRPLQFGANSTYSLFISPDHNVGINCPNPGTGLQISSGTLTIDGNVSPSIRIVGSGAPPDSKALCFLGGSLGHCTTAVGVTGGCTCSVP